MCTRYEEPRWMSENSDYINDYTTGRVVIPRNPVVDMRDFLIPHQLHTRNEWIVSKPVIPPELFEFEG